jgi:ribosomal protein L11 methyltransferase
VKRVALTLRADAVEDVLDVLMPALPQGVYQRELEDGLAEVAFYGDPPALDGLEVLARAEEDVPDDREERRRRVGQVWEIAGRLRVRAPTDPPAAPGVPEVVIEPTIGGFGSGAHPTTRMTLELLLALEPGGGFADLGCGGGVVAIAAAKLGWDPVFGVDVEGRAVEATNHNAAFNGVEVHAVQADLREVPPPPAGTLAGNMPLYVHERVAPALDPMTRHVLASGIVNDSAPTIVSLYEAAGLTERARLSEKGWVAIWLAR